MDVDHNSLNCIDSDLMPQHYILPLNASLVLYTDGLFAVENGQGKKISEKRFGKKMAQLAPQANSATEVTKQILKEFNDHREHSALPDDVSVVVIRRVHSQSLKRYADSADIV